jgi:hypothetical protein
MSFTYHIESNGHIVHVIGTDKGSLEAARDTFANLINDSNLHRPFGLLIDVRTLSNVPSREESESLSKFAAVSDGEKHFTALLVKRGIQYGIARTIQLLSELRGAQIDVFIDERAAQYWLWEQLAFAAKSKSSDAPK